VDRSGLPAFSSSPLVLIFAAHHCLSYSPTLQVIHGGKICPFSPLEEVFAVVFYLFFAEIVICGPTVDHISINQYFFSFLIGMTYPLETGENV